MHFKQCQVLELGYVDHRNDPVYNIRLPNGLIPFDKNVNKHVDMHI